MNLDELEALAKAATQGPWHHDILKSLGPTVKAEVTALGKTIARTYPTGSYIQDAAFIAAANPETILSLISLLKEMAEAVSHAVSNYDFDLDFPDVHCRDALAHYKEIAG